MTPRQKAQYLVDAFNRSYQVGTMVTYLKSEIEGRQLTTVEAAAYIQGDDTPMVELNGIGTALIDKVEPYVGGSAAVRSKEKQRMNNHDFWIGIAVMFGISSVALLIAFLIQKPT